MSKQKVPVELKASQYYFHRSYVPSYYWIYVFLEKWLASNIFRNDSSRVFMSSPEYAFRRRFELTDASKDYDSIEASSLRFPFANYWPLNTGWVADKRPAANSTPLIYLGVYEGNTRIQAASVVHNIPVTFYFDREDDARLAYDKLFFYTYNEHPYFINIPFGAYSKYPDGSRSSGNNLNLPIVINIEGIQFNPDFKEKDWLNKNRIFIIRANFDCRSYAILPPSQPDYKVNMNNPDFIDSYDDGQDAFYLTNDVILNMANNTYDVAVYEGVDLFPEKGSDGVIYVDSTLYDGERHKNIPSEVTPIPSDRRYYRWNNFLNDGVGGYELCSPSLFCASSVRVDGSVVEGLIKISRLYIKEKSATSGTIAWNIENPDDLDRIDLIIGNSLSPIRLDANTTEYSFEDLVPNSTYYMYLDFYAKDGSATRLWIELITDRESEKEELDSLVGTKW